MKKISNKSRAVLDSLLDYVSETGEQDLIPEVTKSLEKEVARAQRADEIIVTSTVKLTPMQLKTIRKSLEKMLHIKFPMVNKIDKGLIGGFTIRVNDWFMDASISRQVEMLKQSLLV